MRDGPRMWPIRGTEHLLGGNAERGQCGTVLVCGLFEGRIIYLERRKTPVVHSSEIKRQCGTEAMRDGPRMWPIWGTDHLVGAS